MTGLDFGLVDFAPHQKAMCETSGPGSGLKLWLCFIYLKSKDGDKSSQPKTGQAGKMCNRTLKPKCQNQNSHKNYSVEIWVSFDFDTVKRYGITAQGNPLTLCWIVSFEASALLGCCRNDWLRLHIFPAWPVCGWLVLSPSFDFKYLKWSHSFKPEPQPHISFVEEIVKCQFITLWAKLLSV